MDRATQLQFLVSGDHQSGRVNFGHDTTAAALKKANELVDRGYSDVRICTPRGRILRSDEFDQLEA
jgi:hypothetical protein